MKCPFKVVAKCNTYLNKISNMKLSDRLVMVEAKLQNCSDVTEYTFWSKQIRELKLKSAAVVMT